MQKMTTLFNNAIEPTQDQVYRFVKLAEKLKSLLEKVQIDTKTTQNNFSHFRILDDKTQIRINEQFETYVNTLASVMSEPEIEKDIDLEKKLVWRFLSYLKLSASNDLYAKLSADDFVEIYNTNGVQIYRSFNFFSVCSYTIEETICLPWFQLYQRRTDITKAYLEIMSQLNTPEYQKTCVQVQIPQHELVEIFSAKQYTVTIEPNFVTSLMRIGSHELAGALNTFKVKELKISTQPSGLSNSPDRIYS